MKSQPKYFKNAAEINYILFKIKKIKLNMLN